jgi:hypothetical protein
MGLNIVTVNVTKQVASAPSTLQQTGALISIGGTNTVAGTLSLLTQLADLTPLTAAPLALASLTWASDEVTATAAAAHGVTVGNTFQAIIAGATPTGYNGTFTATATTAEAFTYPLASNPGTETIPGTYASPYVTELVNMATEFYAQGANLPVYVLELGLVSPAEGIIALQTWITANPRTIYRWMLPIEWDNATGLTGFLNAYTALTAMTYFHITTTLGTYTNYVNTQKCVNLFIASPGAPQTEFGAVADFWSVLNNQPSAVNKVPPTANRFVFDVTAYPVPGNSALLTTLKTANINTIGTGAEAGISNTLLHWGKTLDGHDESWWYAVDWMQINAARALAKAVINGANTPQNPLYYNQPGINTLQAVAQGVYSSGVSFGMFLGGALATAQSFQTYTSQNPDNYATGIYGGLALTATPQNGFESITFNFNVSDFVPATA